MAFDDPLSLWCLEKDPKWPPIRLLKQRQRDINQVEYDLNFE